MFCPNCGKEIPAGSKFCGNCGYNIDQNTGIPKVSIPKIDTKKIMESESTKKIKSWFSVKENKLIFIAIALMLLSVFMACKGYNYDKDGFQLFKWELGGEHSVVTLMPNLLSTLVAIALYSGVVIRNKFEIFQEPIKVTLCVVNILFLASLTTVFISAKPWSIPFFNISNYAILVVAIALSWLGMKAVSGYAWIILLITSIGQMTKVNEAMGFNGTIYILSAFISMGLQLASGFLVVDFESLKSEFYNTKEIAVGDMNKSIEATKVGIDNVVNVGKVAATAATGVPFTAIQSNNTSATNTAE